jgi:hypothetical protein
MFPKKVLVFDDVFQHIHRVDVCHRILEDILHQMPTLLSAKDAHVVYLTDFAEGHVYDDIIIDGTILFRSSDKLEKDWPDRYKEVEIYKSWQKYQEEIRLQESKEYIKFLLNKYGEGYIYRLVYSDECSRLQSMIEHGNTFKNLPHIQFSYH